MNAIKEETELYCSKLYDALCRNPGLVREDNIYNGRDGCLRLAREYGHALRDYKDKKQIENDIKCSYSVLCIRIYNLRPPIDAKTWNKEIRKELEKGE